MRAPNLHLDCGKERRVLVWKWHNKPRTHFFPIFPYYQHSSGGAASMGTCPGWGSSPHDTPLLTWSKAQPLGVVRWCYNDIIVYTITFLPGGSISGHSMPRGAALCCQMTLILCQIITCNNICLSIFFHLTFLDLSKILCSCWRKSAWHPTVWETLI